MYSIEDIQDGIANVIKSGFTGVKVVEQAVPNINTIKRDAAGKVVPYIAYQFGDLQEGTSHSMVGPEGDDYRIPVYVQCVSGDAREARRFANKIVTLLLGATFPWAGQVRKRPGGGMWSLVTSDPATEAYQFPASFSITAQYHTEP